jgi:hypothetical protein
MAAVTPGMRAERQAIARAIRLTAVVDIDMRGILHAAMPLLGFRHRQDGTMAGRAV